MQINKGSEWNRWDLHIHTPDTKLNDQFKDMDGNKVNKSENNLIWKEYCRKLNESGVKVFGITDYFSVTNYLFLKENRDNLGLDKDIKLFPNVELRVTGLVPKGKNRSPHKQVNVHVVFSNDVSSDELNEFLTNLKVEDDSGKRLNFKNHLDTLIENGYFSHVPDYRSIEQSLKSSLVIHTETIH